MYTIGYRMIMNCLGKEWADVISKKCSAKSRGRLVIPFQHQNNKVKYFMDFIRDERVAEKLIRDFGGQRLCVNKYASNTHSKLARRSAWILLQAGMNVEEVIAITNYDPARKLIKKLNNQKSLEQISLF